jgi:hypothetical protein
MNRVGIVDHAGEVVYKSYVYVNPVNVVDWCTPCMSPLYSLPTTRRWIPTDV